MASSSRRLLDAWWEGTGLWYNQGNYRDAMVVFWQALVDSQNIIDHPITEQHDVCSVGRLEDEWENASDQRGGNFDVKVSRLLLFLAGCYLDASDMTRAKQCLHASLRLARRCCSNSAGEVAADALQEFMSACQEDAVCYPTPWLQARRLVQLALRQPQFIHRWTDSYQRAAHIYPNVKSKAIYPSKEQPAWCKLLEANFESIQTEFEHLLASSSTYWPAVGAGDHRGGAGSHDGAVVEGGDWREIVLFGSGARPELAPATSNLIRQVTTQCHDDVVSLAEMGAGEVIFSVLKPRTRILPHTASHNLRLTAHLGLRVPTTGNCHLRVADTTYQWGEGKMLVFDDSYEHEVINESDQLRGVLLLRFWHPSIPVHARNEALQRIVTAKEDDRLRRCNPPLPLESSPARARGMERSQCSTCWKTGYESIRCIVEQRRFVCVCGSIIE